MSEEYNWQEHRMLSPYEIGIILSVLKLSQAAAGRYLGRSKRTVKRYLTGEANIPPAEALLLQSLLAANVKPLVPKRERR